MMALEGVKVLDLSRAVPGPYCSMLLADAGADCIVVEAPPGVREASRAHLRGEAGLESPPPQAEAERLRAHDPLRRNKRSIAINLKDPQGKAVVERLARWADVLVEGFRPGVTDRLGLGYRHLSQCNPRLIYCSLSGYGHTGPYRDVVGHDINYIALGGLLGTTGHADGRPALPLNVAGDIAGGGLLAAFGIMQALYARERTGRGQHLDIAMSDGVLYLMAWHAGRVLAGQPAPQPGRGRLGGEMPYYGVYQCADGLWISLGCFDSHFWKTLCEVLQRPDLIPLQHDGAHRDAVKSALTEIFLRRSRDEWCKLLLPHEVCIAPVLGLDEALQHEHQLARGMVTELQDPRLGSVRHIGIGVRMSETPGRLRSTAPVLGQHTDEVLSQVGYDHNEIADLRVMGIVS
jgi:crotonobetainyl-CoA:carnitine CoA-transferase CaiB-like acyl-CoA transferase